MSYIIEFKVDGVVHWVQHGLNERPHDVDFIEMENLSLRIQKDYNGEVTGAIVYMTGITDCSTHDEFMSLIHQKLLERYTFERFDDIPDNIIEMYREDDEKLR